LVQRTHLYADVALPVPLDRVFTYSLPETLQHRVQDGARVTAPFGPRKLTGVVTKTHNNKPDHQTRDILTLIDEEPALTPELLKLGAWIASYYCSPIGETLKVMLPLGGELRSKRTVALTDRGREMAQQFLRSTDANDPFVQILRALEKRPLTDSYLRKKVPGSEKSLKLMEKRGLIRTETDIAERDPHRARDGRWVVTLAETSTPPTKPTKGERWLLDYLRDHPGEQDIEALELQRKDAGTVARKLAKKNVVELKILREVTSFRTDDKQVQLNPAQQTAFDAISAALAQGKFKTFLLHGVTGSGKTEVYLRAIAAALEAGKSALLLVPEIGLTPAVASQFFLRFGDRVAILHSAFTGWQRSEQWRRIRSGEARVVIGTRSGVFAPVENLGLVIVDEEHESSYKQEEMPRYHGRDVAVKRAADAGAVVVLGSATPSLESRLNAEKERYALIEMRKRVANRPMPEVEIVDMRQEFVETRQNSLFSRTLAEQIEEKIKAGEQAMILLNRRGFAMHVLCRACGERVECENCSVTLTYHRREERLLCHYCDFATPVPQKCPKCDDEHIYFQGSGSEKVEDSLRQQFPTARIARLDRDAVKSRDSYESILNSFREGAYDLLVGTQMIAKGHDIPNVTLVGVVSADVGLGIPDFRAAERTFQLLTQVAGRAGRGELPGKVILQTMNPEHYAIELAAAQNYDAFYKQEIHFRKMMHYPPFTSMATLLLRSQKLEETLAWSAVLAKELSNLPDTVRVMGPAAAPMAKLKREYRFQFLLKASSRRALANAVQRARAFARQQEWPVTALTADIDPVSLL
jgi:primosomal protein N' (replication factor Y)